MPSGSRAWEQRLQSPTATCAQFEEFEAEAKDMTADSAVVEIEAMGGSAIGIGGRGNLS